MIERLHRVEDSVFREDLPSGLAVLVIPKPGFTKKYATFTAHYGSVDNHFKTPEGEEMRVPDGIAHFLEHKMFAKPYGDAFDRFSEIGASPNAYTTYTSTTYLFSAAAGFEPAFELLLDFVQEPHFTPEGVEKERGIISQELRMYADSPHWRLFQNLRECLFQRHPIRIDIGGTLESIAKIDADLLLRCYRTFYHPSNMAVAVVGDVDPEAVVRQVEANLERHGGYERKGPIDRIFPEEPAAIARPRAEASMSVARPLLALGFKERHVPCRGLDLLRRELLTSIVLESALGKASPLYNRLYENGLIGRAFSANTLSEDTFGMAVVSGETDDPAGLEAELRKGLRQFTEGGVDRADFERIRRRLYGDFVGEFDSPESLAHALTDAYFEGISLGAYLELVESLTPDDATARARECLDEDALAVSVVTPAP